MTTSVSLTGSGYAIDQTDPLGIFQAYQVTSNMSKLFAEQLSDVPEINGGKKDDEEDEEGEAKSSLDSTIWQQTAVPGVTIPTFVTASGIIVG